MADGSCHRSLDCRHIYQRQDFAFLVLSGLATGASWLCYFRALQKGDINKVVPIDKSSTVLTILLALIFLHEGITWVKGISIVMIGVGTMLMITKRKLQMIRSCQGKMSNICQQTVAVWHRNSGEWDFCMAAGCCTPCSQLFCQSDSDTRQGRDIGYQLKSGHGDQDNGGSCHGLAYGVCVRKTA